MTWLLVPLIGSILCWSLSFRRTPWQVLWVVVLIPLTLFGGVEVAAALAVHHTLVGMLGVSLASVLPQVFCAFLTELAAQEEDAISAYRAGRRAAKRGKAKRWEVRTEPVGDRVGLFITRGGARREIGSEDPIQSPDEFMDLKVRAEQAAETYNALEVGG